MNTELSKKKHMLSKQENILKHNNGVPKVGILGIQNYMESELGSQRRPLRLKGGVALEEEEEMRCSLKSPIQECKSIMDKFDEILAAYKSSLGPCGEATCPYSQSMMQDSCRKKCHSAKIVLDAQPPVEECEGDPCQNEECPYVDKKKRFTPGCGSPNCAYTKYKLGLVDQDASLELMMLPPAISGRCGSPNCDYPIAPDLPPIHWDCPDPLPKGACKNLNCPLQPHALKKINVSTKKKICSCQDCPYAFPPPCGLPSCPFRENPCPFVEKEKVAKDCSYTSSFTEDDKNKDECSNPSCPFAPGSLDTTNNDDSKYKGEILVCTNPNCPFATKQMKMPQEICKNNDCPWKNKTKRSSRNSKIENIEKDGNPSCPYATCAQGSIDKSSLLETPETRMKHSNDDSQCLDTPKNFDSCPNPNCPFEKQKTRTERIEEDLCNKTIVCNNPNCSYQARRSLSPDPEEFSKSNAECVDSDENCDNPDCPYMNDERRSTTNKEELCYYAENEEEDTTNEIVVETNLVIKTDQISNANKSNTNERSKQPKKKRGKYVYTMGNMYPGVKIGHKECVTQVFNVPPKMGWLWNIPPNIVRLKPRRGWKPGALTRTIARRIRAHRQAQGLGLLRVPKFEKLKEGEELGGDIAVSPKPTLYIQKKEGAYSIIMNPLKDPKTLADNENPYMDCTPMRFKISPTKPKKSGSQTCFCDEEDEENSSSESELDIEFTPPAGIIHPERFKKKLNVIHCETQYDTQDFEQKDKKGQTEKGKKGGKGGKGGKGKRKGKGKGKKGKK